jgi:hypothetical protein
MKSMQYKVSRFLPLLAALAVPFPAEGAPLENDSYTLTLQPDHGVRVRSGALPAQVLGAEFTVMYSDRNPGFAVNRQGRFDRMAPRPFPGKSIYAQRWSLYSDDPADPDRETRALGVRGDVRITVNSVGERFLHYQNQNGEEIEAREMGAATGTANPYLAGKRNTLKASNATIDGNTIIWQFPEQPGFSLDARVVISESGDPRIECRLRVKKSGYYSVAYTGAPWMNEKESLKIPRSAMPVAGDFLNTVISEAQLSLPRVHLATGEFNSALVVDPKESPFRLVEDSKGVWTCAIADESNSRFGVMVEAKDGLLRPVVFAPLMGGFESKMEAGAAHDFTLRYVLRGGSWEDTFKYIARDIYNFRDMRDNSGPGPMYKTIENLMDYLGNRDGKNYSMWHAEQKYHNYWSDLSGIFKPFSPLFSLSAAILTDDEDYFRARARPMMEFAVSRKTNAFAPYTVYNAGMVSTLASPLGGPYIDAGQLHSLHGMLQNRNHVFSHYAKAKPAGKNALQNAFIQYRLTGDEKHLEDAKKLAARGAGSYLDILEIYEETGDSKLLQAALAKAYQWIVVMNLFPSVPDEEVTLEKGNRVPIHGHAWQRHEDWGFPPPRAVGLAGQKVPAWRASLVGTELSAYRGGYWINTHGQLMRLATHAGDHFLRDMQRWAMVGRYGNYAGDFRSNRHSLVSEWSEAPNRHIFETNFSTYNPGHACEWIGAVIDFMVSDLFNRSAMKIDFPSRGMYGAGFRVKTYGDRPGHFYDEQNVWLWLPRHLLESDNKQIDYAGGHGNGKFYAAFWNQSFKKEKVVVKFNPALVSFPGSHRARIWVNNRDMGTVDVKDNGVSFEIEPKGIVCYAIEGAKVTLGLQARLLAKDSVTLGKDSFAEQDTSFGKVTAMLLSAGKGLTHAFVYTHAQASDVISARLRHRQGGGEWKEVDDLVFPYEFSLDIDESKGAFQCVFEVETTDQQIKKSETITLKF